MRCFVHMESRIRNELVPFPGAREKDMLRLGGVRITRVNFSCLVALLLVLVSVVYFVASRS